MTISKKATNRTVSIPAGLTMGGLCSLFVTLVGTAFLAKLIDGNVFQESSIGYGVMIILTLASFLGALLAYSKVKRQRLLLCMGTGLILFLVLLCITAVFFEGQYTGIGVTALLILGGSGLAVLLGLGNGRAGKQSKIRIPNR